MKCPKCGGPARWIKEIKKHKCLKCGETFQPSIAGIPEGVGEFFRKVEKGEKGEKWKTIKIIGRKIKQPYESYKKGIELRRKAVLPELAEKFYGTKDLTKLTEEQRKKLEEEAKKMVPTIGDRIKKFPQTLAIGLAAPFLLGGLKGEDRRRMLLEMARGNPQLYSLLAKPTPYQIFGEILFVLAIVLWTAGNWPLALALFWVGFLILSIYTGFLLVASIFPICLLVYLLWFGPFPNIVGISVTLFLVPFLIFLALIVEKTWWRVIFTILILVVTLLWVVPGLYWTPGYPDWLKKAGIPLAGTTPHSILSNILPIPPALVTILGWVIVVLTFHVAYTSTLASPILAQEPARAFFDNLLVVFAVFFILGIDWVEAARAIHGGVDYFTCITTEFTSMRWLTTGKDVFEVCRKKEEKIILHKFGMYNFFNVKLGVEEFNYRISSIYPGRDYTLWFTITNLKNEEFLISNIFTNQPVYNHTDLNLTDDGTHLKITKLVAGEENVELISKADLPSDMVNEVGEKVDSYVLSTEGKGWFIDYVKQHELSRGKLINLFKKANCTTFIIKDGNNYLKTGDNGCFAKIFIPSDLKEYAPRVIVTWNQSVQGYEKIRMVSGLKYVEKYYKPICIEEKGVIYECPTTTEGPIDLGVSFVPKQYVVGITPSLQVVVGISNDKVNVTAKFLNTPLIEGFDLGGCKSEIEKWFETVPWKYFTYRKRPYITDPPCDLKEKGKLPESLDVPYVEYKIKISANYTYIQPFDLPTITSE